MIIAIDGPSASGKSTIGRLLARHLGLPLVDTGLMYRAVTVVAADAGVGPAQPARLAEIAREADIQLNTEPVDKPPWLVRVGGVDLTARVFDAAIAPTLARVSQVPEVRQALVARQRAYASGGVVMVGRDIGTVVFPGADHKLFVIASEAERVRRRQAQMKAGEVALLKGEISDRDEADTQRSLAPLRPASDALTIDTDGRSIEAVFAEVLGLISDVGPGPGARDR